MQLTTDRIDFTFGAVTVQPGQHVVRLEVEAFDSTVYREFLVVSVERAEGDPQRPRSPVRWTHR